ncbi:hypothetical protein BDV06DRAFT_188379, partial [Aspergillus oleicola]
LLEWLFSHIWPILFFVTGGLVVEKAWQPQKQSRSSLGKCPHHKSDMLQMTK